MGMPRDEARSGALAATWIGLIAFVACLAPAAYLFPRLEHMRFYNLFPDAFPPRGSAAGGIPATARVYVEPGFARLVPLLETAVALVVAGTAVSAWASFRRRPGLALTCLVGAMGVGLTAIRSEEHTSELQSLRHLVCRLLLEKKKNKNYSMSAL